MRVYQMSRDRDGVRLARSERPTRAPGPGEVRIRIEAVSFNFRDLIVRDGAA